MLHSDFLRRFRLKTGGMKLPAKMPLQECGPAPLLRKGMSNH